MPISTRAWYRGPSSYGLFPPGVKWLLIINTAVFVVGYFAAVANYPNLFLPFALIPAWVLKGAVWQLFTYMFLHAGFQHILFNMLSLWWFGVMLEQTWGTRRFLNFYFICGVGAGVCVVLGNLLFGGNLMDPTVGASGAIYGV